MGKDEKASLQIVKVIVASIIILAMCSAIAVWATNSQLNNVEIIFSNNYTMNVLTAKTKVQDILDENHIVLESGEIVSPLASENITDNKIVISKKNNVIAETVKEISTEEILEDYSIYSEKIIVEQVVIPFETVTKDVSEGSETTTNTVLQEGQDGLKEITYKVKYKDNVEIERIVIKEEVITEAIDKVIQVNKKVIVSRQETARSESTSTVSTASGNSLASKVSGKEPVKKTFNVSAYTASTCGKSSSSPGYGITSSGARARAYYTLAAGSGYPVGTIIYIPYFKNSVNGGWFVVQDRGGAISNNRLDVYMDTYNECIKFGRRNLECYVYQ